jgi:hypothetical protein
MSGLAVACGRAAPKEVARYSSVFLNQQRRKLHNPRRNANAANAAAI